MSSVPNILTTFDAVSIGVQASSDGEGRCSNSKRAEQMEVWTQHTKNWETELAESKGFHREPYSECIEQFQNLETVQKDFINAMVEIMVLRVETYQQFIRTRQSQQKIKISLMNVLIADFVARGDPDWLKGEPQRAVKKPYFKSPSLASAPQIAALLLDVYNDEEWTFRTLRVLTALMTPLYEKDFLQMKNDTLLLTSYLYDEEIDLVNYLNGKTKEKILIDLIDISDIVRTWIQGIFAHHFKPVFVELVLDRLLKEGPSVLIAFVYGILATFKDEIIEEDDDAGFYRRIWTLPSSSDDPKKISMIFKKFEELYNKESITDENSKNWVESERSKKDWDLLLMLKTQKLTITKQSGDYDWARKRLERDNAIKEREDMIKEAELFDKIDHRNSQRFPGDEEGDQDDEKAALTIEALEKDVHRLQELDTKHIERIEWLRSQLKKYKPLNRPSRVKRQDIISIKLTALNYEDVLQKPAPKIAKTSNKRYDGWNKSYRESLRSVRGPCVYMQGSLLKISRRTKERWFVLKDHYLAYYKSPMNTTPQRDRCLDIRGHIINPTSHDRGKFAMEIVEAKPDGTPVTPREKHRLLLITCEKTARENQQIREMWLTALRSAAARPRFRLSVALDHTLKQRQKKKDGHHLKYPSRMKRMHARHLSQQMMTKDGGLVIPTAARSNTQHIRQRSGNSPRLDVQRSSPPKSFTRIDRRTRSHSGNSIISRFSRESDSVHSVQKGVPLLLKSNRS